MDQQEPEKIGLEQVASGNYEGRFLRVYEAGSTFAGPIKSIEVFHGYLLNITLEWLAVSESGSQNGPWHIERSKDFFFFKQKTAYEIEKIGEDFQIQVRSSDGRRAWQGRTFGTDDPHFTLVKPDA